MSLFKAKILSQYIQDEQVIEERYALLQAYQKKADDIKNFKEEQYQVGFLEDIFEKCLGYTLKIHNPKNYNLEREKKNETDSKKADAVIYNKKGEVIAVIELKDQKTQDLKNAVEQAFNYHTSHQTSKYIIVSNFNELRFYIDKKTGYEQFNLFTMDKNEFRRFYLILNYQSIVSDLPIEIKQKSDIADIDISKKLYADFSQFRLQLFNDAKQNNSNISQKKLLRLIQKFCDRIIFILFAEDKGLLKPNTIAEIEEKHKQIKGIANISLYQIYQKYFQAIDKGSTDLGIMPYNGGLFSEDKELDALKIDDSILHNHLPKLSAYDFKSDISVNILGHIFEQSLSDLEEINAAIDNQQFDYNQSKRKKDGIFYTPEYITQFIVEQTLGKICLDKKEELVLNGEIRLPEKIKKKLNKEEQNLLDRLYQYRNFLLELKIIDPACGSGAFLNQALEFLIKEHHFIDKHRRILENESLGLYDIEISILENNLYGVDINADAVEIAKLSLWLRTAQNGRKLTDLSNNIKCGNSLIDDKIVDKNAFIWEQEFPQIMANGGFDIVIGNPPYVNINTQPNIHTYLKENYNKIHTGYNDLMYYFLYKGISLLKSKNNSYFGMIVSNYFLGNEYAKKLRIFLKNHIQTIIDFRDYFVFTDANVHTAIVFAKNNDISQYIDIYIKNNNNNIQEINFIKNFDKCSILRNELSHTWIIATDISNNIIRKIKKNSILLGSISEIAKGAETGKNGIFSVPKEIIEQYNIENEIVRLCVKNSSIQKYKILKNDLFLIYTDNSFSKEKYPNAYNYLLQFKETLLDRRGPKNSEYEWWRLHRPSIKDIFDAKEKIIVPYRAEHNRFAYDNEQYFNDGGDIRAIVIKNNLPYSIKFILSILNSKLFDWYYGFIGKTKGSMREYFNTPLSEIPIKDINLEQQQPFIKLADKMLSLNAELNDKKSRFISRLQQNFANIKIKGGLHCFWTLAFADFVNELKKQKIKLTLTEQDEWEKYFSQYQNHLTALQHAITITDKTIDTMVYQLYNLTDEEIKIVEQA